MSSAARPSAIALHVEAAKRLLDALERHADVAIQALGSENGEGFTAAVDERDRILVELNEVVEALAHERLTDADGLPAIAQAASAALESHEALLERTRQERDRLAAALDRAGRPDAIAHQYAAATNVRRSATLSVTG